MSHLTSFIAHWLGAELCKLSLQAPKYVFVNVKYSRIAWGTDNTDTSLILKKLSLSQAIL